MCIRDRSLSKFLLAASSIKGTAIDEVTFSLADTMLHLGLNLAVHQNRARRSAAANVCRDQICHSLGHPDCHSIRQKVTVCRAAHELEATCVYRSTVVHV